jgi:hypothetical protein
MKDKTYDGYGKAINDAKRSMGFRNPEAMIKETLFDIEFFTSRPKVGSPNGHKLARINVELDVPDSFIRGLGDVRKMHAQQPGLLTIDGDKVTVNNEGYLINWRNEDEGFIVTKKVEEQKELTKKEIIAQLEAAGIEYPAKANKEQLAELLPA